MILTCGEALIDMLPRETPEGDRAFLPRPGGAVFNTAVALGRLGAPVQFFGGLSSDFLGDLLRDTLADSNVDFAPAHVSGRPTTLAFVRLVNGHAEYTFYDENTAGRMLTEADLPKTEANAVFFGGISLAAEPCGAAYEELMLREADSRVTMIDPNIRPGFVADAAAYRARIGRMCSAADIVKLSDEDLAWLSDGSDAQAQVRRLLNAGVRLVCITEGARGVTAYTARHNVFVKAEPVEVVDTVGAGDTFNAGLLAGLHEQGLLGCGTLAELAEEELRCALSLGARAAAIAVSRTGANPPTRAELQSAP